jgi:hypothetical protein
MKGPQRRQRGTRRPAPDGDAALRLVIGDPAQGVGRIARPRADTPGRVGAPRDPAKPALDPARRRNWRAATAHASV